MKKFIVTALLIVTCLFVWITPVFADGSEGGWVDPQKTSLPDENGQVTTPCQPVPDGDSGTSSVTIMDYLGISPIVQVAVIEIINML